MAPWAAGPRQREHGYGLLVCLLTMALVAVLGTALVTVDLADLSTSDNYRSSMVAFYAADSGLQQTLADLVADSSWAAAVVDGALPLGLQDPFPSSITINGNTVTLATSGGDVVPGFYALGGTVSLGEGSFTRQVWLPPSGIELANAKGSKAWVLIPVRSVGLAGQAEPSSQTVQGVSRVLVTRLSVWDNAIFAGTGQGGNTVNGNVQVRGSVHVLGDPNDPTVIEWGGTAAVLNHYDGATDNDNFGADGFKLPPLPTRTVNGEVVQTLDAEIRVRDGTVTVGGSVSLGQPDQPGNGVKETLDGVWVNGGVSTSGNASVSADETGPYDAGPNVTFPSLSDPYYDAATGTLYNTHRDYLNAVALTLPVNEISANTPAFKIEDASGNSVEWDPDDGELEISGIVRVDGDLHLGPATGGGGGGSRPSIKYEGTGTLYATQNIYIHTDVLPSGSYLDSSGSGGTHNLGLIADQDLEIATGGGESWVKIMAALYAEGVIRIAKQSRIAGAMVSNTYDLGQNVPRVFQVPQLAGMLPPGMPGAGPMLIVTRADLTDWRQVR